jgi:hypothetical protein
MGRSLICVGFGRHCGQDRISFQKNERERNLLHRQTPLRQRAAEEHPPR